MKLNNKRTILVGLAFLSICAFWQMYDNVIPLILTKTFHMNETYSGAIMAADNILALFLLPFFGSLSDRSHSKIGKRMPFILFGTGCAVILMNILPLLDNSYAAQPSGFKTASFVIVLGLLLVDEGQAQKLLAGGGIDVHGLVVQHAQLLQLRIPLMQGAVGGGVIALVRVIIAGEQTLGIFLHEVVPRVGLAHRRHCHA